MDNKIVQIPENSNETENISKPPCHRVVISNEKWEISDDDYIAENQQKIFTEGCLNNKTFKKMKQEIKRKINSYKTQDKTKKIFDEDNFIDYETIRELILKNNFKCYYCKENIKILYQFVRESKQWSVERIDNKFGHNKENVTIACLNCNLHRRTMYHERFVFTKQLNIVKTDI
jgi:hypothetical protein